MFLLIDYGNTYLKLVTLDALSSSTIDNAKSLRIDDLKSLSAWLEQSAGRHYQAVLVSSVRDDQTNQQLKSILNPRTENLYWAKTESNQCGIQCAYDRPQDMGVDRWLGILAADEINPASILISVGSAVTIDVLLNRQHLGGHIIPGYRLQLESLQMTGRVRPEPDFEAGGGFSLGQSTTACVHSGLLSLFNGYLSQVIDEAMSKYPLQRIFFTGGGGQYWADVFAENYPVRYEPGIVLKGLARAFLASQGDRD